jgi:hypothetical protein
MASPRWANTTLFDLKNDVAISEFSELAEFVSLVASRPSGREHLIIRLKTH